MTDDIESRIKAYQQQLIEPAATLFAVQRIYGDQVRAQSMSAYGRLVDAHLLLTGTIGAALLRVNGKITEISATGDHRDALFASFVIGLDGCEHAIAEGRYLQAHALLRQEMETVAQLTAIQLGRHKDGQTPNVGVLEKSLSRLYGDLSAAAHVAKHDVVRAATKWDMSNVELSGPTIGTRYFPGFDEGLARRSFGLHLMLIARAIEQMSIHYSVQHAAEDQFQEADCEAVNLALSLMLAEGVIEADD